MNVEQDGDTVDRAWGRYEQIRRRRRSNRVKQTIFIGDNDEKNRQASRQTTDR